MSIGNLQALLTMTPFRPLGSKKTPQSERIVCEVNCADIEAYTY